jgi:hypothetical protein
MPRMGILVVAVLATCVGFVLILLIGRNQPVSPASPQFAGLEVATELAWVRDFGVEGFQRLLLTLFAEMGFSPERSERGAHSVDLYAVDPTPIRGGRLYVHGVLGTPGKALEADEVRNLIETARGELIGKGVLVTLGRISADARDTARGNPIDLLDGDELAKLVKKHLPQAYATRRV